MYENPKQKKINWLRLAFDVVKVAIGYFAALLEIPV